MMFVGNLGYAGVALCGGLLAIKGVITIGDIQAFIQYVRNFTQPIQQIAQVANQVQSIDNQMPGEIFLYLSVDMSQVFLLGTEKLLGLFHNNSD